MVISNREGDQSSIMEVKILQEKLQQYQDQIDALKDDLKSAKHENDNLKFELQRIHTETKDLELSREQWSIQVLVPLLCNDN